MMTAADTRSTDIAAHGTLQEKEIERERVASGITMMQLFMVRLWRKLKMTFAEFTRCADFIFRWSMVLFVRSLIGIVCRYNDEVHGTVSTAVKQYYSRVLTQCK